MLHSCKLVLCLLVLLTGAYAADRSLKVTIEPIHSPVTKRFDERLALHSSDISPDDPRVQKKGKACEQPEQVGSLGGHAGICDCRQLSLALLGQEHHHLDPADSLSETGTALCQAVHPGEQWRLQARSICRFTSNKTLLNACAMP